MKTSRSFTADPGSTRSARHFVLQAAGSAPPRLRDAIAVMVGELAMNAVQHARTDFEVTVELTGGILRVQVTDSAGNRPAATVMPPPMVMPPPTSSRGRGLPIVAGFADDWGVIPSPHGPGKTIWFTIAIPAQPGNASRHKPRAINPPRPKRDTQMCVQLWLQYGGGGSRRP
jgi:anti-sigma regulatory factor (Ser/Thr protein kinase)